MEGKPLLPGLHEFTNLGDKRNSIMKLFVQVVLSAILFSGRDNFRRLGTDGEPGEAFEFEREASGAIFRIKRHNNYFTRINKVRFVH